MDIKFQADMGRSLIYGHREWYFRNVSYFAPVNFFKTFVMFHIKFNEIHRISKRFQSYKFIK